MLTVDLKLDGVSIANRVKGWTVTWDRSAMHNSLSVDSEDAALFASTDPDPETGRGTARLTVVMGSDELSFLLEERSGGEPGFSFSGRSVSALMAEYAGTVSVELSSGIAKIIDVANLISATVPVVWGYDYAFESPKDLYWLPKTFSFSGSPGEGVNRLREVLGGAARCQDDGTIRLEPYYPMSPSEMGYFDPDAVIDADDEVEEVSYALEPGEGFDAVTIRAGVEYDQPDIEVLNGDAVIGEREFLRVFWSDPYTVPETWASSGTVTPGVTGTYAETVTVADGAAKLSWPVSAMLTEGVEWDPWSNVIRHATDGPLFVSYVPTQAVSTLTLTERVEFRGGSASVSKIIRTLESVEWVGASGGAVEFDEGGKDLRCAETAAVADVTYTAQCQVWALVGCAEDTALVGFAPPAIPPRRVVVYGGGANPAPDVDDADAFYDDGVAREHGKRIIYDSRTWKRLSFSMPMDRRLRDGMLVELQSGPVLSVSGRCYVTKVTAKIDEVAQRYEVEVIQ